MNMNTRNINAAGKPETISTSRKLNNAVAAIHERRYQARKRFQALEEKLKELSSREVSYVSVNGISMPVPRG